jgi:methylmalonyl-CoA mutase C-terminal domain/subunit
MKGLEEPMRTERHIRVLIAKIGLDGHDVGAKVLVHWLRDQGMEVIYTGLRQTADMVVEAALQEDVDVIGVSVLSGSHMEIANRLRKRIKEKGVEDILLLFGGIIPREDVSALKTLGVDGVFPAHSDLKEISDFIKKEIKAGDHS